jgi:hypothetical protein
MGWLLLLSDVDEDSCFLGELPIIVTFINIRQKVGE